MLSWGAGAILLAVAGLSAIATLMLTAIQLPSLLALVLVSLAGLLSALWQGYAAAVYDVAEPVVLVSLLGGWLVGYQRWGGRWGLATLIATVGLGAVSTGDAVSWLPLLWGAGLGAILLPLLGWVAIAIAVFSDQGLYALLSHSPLVLTAAKLTALVLVAWLGQHRLTKNRLEGEQMRPQ